MNNQLKNNKIENECKEIRKRLEKTETELNDVLSIINSLKDAIVFIDDKKRIIRVNKTFLEVGDFEEEEIIGKSISELRKQISLKSYPKIMNALIKRLLGENIPSYEVILKKKNGKEINVEIIGSPFYKEGKIVGSVAVLRDITKRKRTEKILEKRNEELEKLNKVMTGRELKMIELKDRIKELEEELFEK